MKLLRTFAALLAAVAIVASCQLAVADDKPINLDPYSLIEGPLEQIEGALNPPQAGAVILSTSPADYAWWNGCSPTAGGMLFGFWEEHGKDAFPGSHRNLPATYANTSSNQADYQDARGIVAGWAHKQAGIASGLTYGTYTGHAPDSIADFILTSNSGTSRSDMAWGFQNFGAWDDPRTVQIESQKFTAVTRYTSSGYTYANFCAEIDAGRPVHLGLTSTAGGHSVLAVGYNNTAGKQNVILLTTWHSGLQEWPWTNEPYSGYNFSAYGWTTLVPSATPTPALSAYLSLAHTYVGDLGVVIGVGNPDDPDWSTTVWNRTSGSADNLVLTDIDLTSMLDEFRTGHLNLFLKVTDNAAGGVGTIQDFQIRYNFDELVFDYVGAPAAILDNQTSFIYVTTTPEPGTLTLLAIGGLGAFWKLRRRLKT